MAQPFEVAKLILQVHVGQDDGALDRSVFENGREEYQDEEEEIRDSSDEEPNFFTPSAPPRRFSPVRGRTGRPAGRANGQAQKPFSTHRLPIKNPHSLVDALSSLASSSGSLSLWRATNTTFIYTLLHRTLETFLGSLLAAVLGIAEADVLSPSNAAALPSTSILTSTAPMASLLIATTSSVLSSILLSPIDAARTRLILTPAALSPRSLAATIRTLPSPSYLIPSHLLPITLLTSTIPSLISHSTPLVLKTQLNIDPVLNPRSWSIACFASSALDLVVRYPFETVLRRAQIATWTAPSGALPVPSSSRKAIETIIPVPQSYRGIVSTIWSIMKEEGSSFPKSDKAAAVISGRPPKKARKGQGINGLYRGWRVGMWGLVGVWGASFIGGLQSASDSPPGGISTQSKAF
jgi:mitochondrial fusion and transport protein UGO1